MSTNATSPRSRTLSVVLAAAFAASLLAFTSSPAAAASESSGSGGSHDVVCAPDDPSFCWVDDSHLKPPSPAVSAAFDLQASKDTVTCFGDGKSGARIEALHVVDSAKKKTPTGDLRRYVARAAKVVEDSSRKHGGDVKALRVLHDSNCRPIIKQVVVPSGVFKGSFHDLTSYLREKGYDSIHRKYLLFVDSDRKDICGLGSFLGDLHRGFGNESNWTSGFSYVTKQCWNYAEAHEIFHNLGAVADAAPNATGGAHCVDLHDVMCYDDGIPNGKKMKTVCKDEAWDWLLDCGGDDYFNTGKLAKGSFLENHWNTANSRFLGPINGSEPQTEKIRVSLHAPVYVAGDSATKKVIVEAKLIDAKHGTVFGEEFTFETDLPGFQSHGWSLPPKSGYSFCYGYCALAPKVPNGTYTVKASVEYEGKAYSASQKIVVGDLPKPPPPTGFSDVDPSNVFAGDIIKLAGAGITRGCNPPANDRFCPDDHVTRGQMAAFLVRALKLPSANVSFSDTKGHSFESDIAALAAAGITKGCNPPANTKFCPDDRVTRGQMAAFLVRALKLPSGSASFSDTKGHVFQADIAALAAAGITKGCNPPDNTRFCPNDFVTRAQMAAFLVRAVLS